MQIESRTSEQLVFAPWPRSKRIRSLLGGIGLILIGLLSLATAGLVAVGAIPSADLAVGVGLIGPIGVGIVFPMFGFRYAFHGLSLRLVLTRTPPTSYLQWRDWRFSATQADHADAIVVGTLRGQKRARYFAISIRTGTNQTRIFRSFDYWWSDDEAVRNAMSTAEAIAAFLECRLELDDPKWIANGAA